MPITFGWEPDGKLAVTIWVDRMLVWGLAAMLYVYADDLYRMVA